MKSPICVSKICVTNSKQTASFSIVGLMLAIAPLWLMLAFGSPANAQTSTTDTSPDWTQFHRDNMQRWNPFETALGVGNAGSLKLKWSYGNWSYGSPAVVNGVVYFGSDDGNVYALNASTGAKLWSYNAYWNVASSPAVANGVVYVGCALNLCALDASTGALLWSYNIGFVPSSPAVANGVVYIGSGNDGNVYALNASTGALLWSFATTYPITSAPAVANGVVYISSNLNDIYALNASTGALLWSYPTQAGPDYVSSPAVANGVVYVGCGGAPGGVNVCALNASTGVLLWSYAPVGGTNYVSPAVANGVVYVGASDHNVYALNASTGVKLWSYPTGSSIESAPAVANGVVYIGSDDGNIYALNASTGAKLWSSATGGALSTSSPAVVNGTLYIGSSAYSLASLGADLFLRIWPSTTTVQQGDLITYAFPVWNLGPSEAYLEVLTTQVPEGTTFDYIRISGTPGLGTCTTPPYEGTGEIVCHENSAMAPNTTWTVRLVVKVTAPSGTVITESATTTAETPDPNPANNTATVSMTVQ